MTSTKVAMLSALCALLIPLGAQAADMSAQAAKAVNDNNVATRVVSPEKAKDTASAHKTHMHHAKSHAKAAVKAEAAMKPVAHTNE